MSRQEPPPTPVENLLSSVKTDESITVGGENTVCVGTRLFFTGDGNGGFQHLDSVKLTHNVVSTMGRRDATIHPDGNVTVRYYIPQCPGGNELFQKQRVAVSNSVMRVVSVQLQDCKNGMWSTHTFRMRLISECADGKSFKLEVPRAERRMLRIKRKASVLSRQPQRWQKSVSQLFQDRANGSP